jgi:hypothetical protein
VALAQPDTGPRGIVAIPEKPPLTPEELDKMTGGPTLVTYAGQNVPLLDIIDFFQKASGQGAGQTRRPPVFPKEYPATISVDWKDVPFWTAAAEVEKLTGLRWTQNGFNGLTLVPANPTQNADLGGFLVAETPYLKIYGGTVWHTKVSGASLSSQTPPAGPADTTTVNLALYLDPKIKIVGAPRVMDLKVPGIEVAPPAAVPMTAINRLNIQTLLNGALQGGASLIVPVTLDLPNGIASGTTLPSVTANLRLAAAVSSKVWKIDDLVNAADAQEELNGSQFIVNTVKIENGQLKVALEIDGEAANTAGIRMGGGPGGNMAFNLGGLMNAPGAANMVADMRQAFQGMGGNAGAFGAIPNAQPGIGAPGNFGGAGRPAAGVVGGAFQPGGFDIDQLRNMRGGRGGAFSGIIVRDAKGKVLQMNSQSTKNGNRAVGERPKTQTELGFNLGDADAAGPFSLEWSLPSPPRNIDMSLELKNLKVP